MEPCCEIQKNEPGVPFHGLNCTRPRRPIAEVMREVAENSPYRAARRGDA